MLPFSRSSKKLTVFMRWEPYPAPQSSLVTPRASWSNDHTISILTERPREDGQSRRCGLPAGWLFSADVAQVKDVDVTTSLLPAEGVIWRSHRVFYSNSDTAPTATQELPIHKNPVKRAISLTSLKLFDTTESSFWSPDCHQARFPYLPQKFYWH